VTREHGMQHKMTNITYWYNLPSL